MTIPTKEIGLITTKVQKVSITNPETMKEATALLSKINKLKDALTTEKEKVTKPLNEALKAERARFKPLEEQLETAISTIRVAMTKYQTEATALAQKESAKIAARIGPGKGKLSLDTAVQKLSEIEKPQELVSTDAGAVTFRTVQKFEVTDLAKLPIQYHLADEVAIRAAMKNGQQLPGVRYYEEQVPYNSR